MLENTVQTKGFVFTWPTVRTKRSQRHFRPNISPPLPLTFPCEIAQGLGSRCGRWRVGGPEAGVGWESSRSQRLPACGRAGTGDHPQPALECVRLVEWLALHARAEQGGRDGVHVPAGCSPPGLRPEQRRKDG